MQTQRTIRMYDVVSRCVVRRVTSFLDDAICPMANCVLGMAVHVSDARFTSGLPMVFARPCTRTRTAAAGCYNGLAPVAPETPEVHGQPVRRIERRQQTGRALTRVVFRVRSPTPAPFSPGAKWLFVSCRARTSAAP